MEAARSSVLRFFACVSGLLYSFLQRAGALIADVSFGVGRGCGGCKLTPKSGSRSLGGDERLLELSACFSLDMPAAVRKSFTDFRNATLSIAHSSGQRQAGCNVSLTTPNLVRDCALSFAGLRFVVVI